MPILGAHVSIAKGVHNSIARALEIGCGTFQIFTRNQRRWESPPLKDEEISSFKELLSGSILGPVLAHDSYLINLGTPDKKVFDRSVDVFSEEISRCFSLDIPFLVTHPGAHLGSGIKEGADRFIEGLDRSLSFHEDGSGRIGLTVLLETTAGQGTSMGYGFENLGDLIERSRFSEHLGVCFDTCHVFAAGYDISSLEGYEITFREFDDMIGSKRLKAFHLNDSMKGVGSRVDRHTNIGKGKIGLSGFSMLMKDRRFDGIPMVLETPGGMEVYKKELSLLRNLSLGE